MPTPTVKLSKGTRSIDLRSGRYRVAASWAPPPISEVPLLAEGTSANRSGATLIGRRPVNRTLTIGVDVVGTSSSDVARGISDLQTFLSLAGDEAEPVYLEFKADSDTPEPLWGNYGANLRYEIVTGVVAVSETYGRGLRLASLASVALNLQLRPYAVGKPQRLASALGGLVEDTYGTTDGVSRGLIVAPATTNLFKDPSFELGTLATNWTTDNGAGTGTAVLDTTRSLMGLYSLKMVKGSVYCNVYQSVTTTAATHTVSAYVYKEGGGAVTSSDFRFVFDGAVVVPTGFISVGNGWYRAYYAASETAAAHTTGVRAQGSATIWVDGCQFEAAAVYTPYCDGDMLGCAWTGTRFSSTTTRTAGRARLPTADIVGRTAGSIRMVWRVDRAQSDHSADILLWNIDTSTLRAAFIAASDKIQIHDGTNSALSAALTWSANDTYILHFTWGASGLNIYINGAVNGTNASYAGAAHGTYLYIGTNTSAASPCMGTFEDFAVFDAELTAAQVAADYANIVPLTTAGQRAGAIPWLWTKDGDDIIDNCDDSTRDNFAVTGGVPGSADAVSEFFFTTSGGSLVYLGQSVVEYPDWLTPRTRGTYQDLDGTVDANSSSGQRFEDPGIDLPQLFGTIVQPARPLTGQMHFLMRLGASASSWSMAGLLGYGASSSDLIATTAGKTISGATLGGWYFGSLMLPVYRTRNVTPTLVAGYIGSIGAGVTGYLDIVHCVIGRLAKIDISLAASVYINGSSAFGLTSLSTTHPAAISGDIVELTPNRSNTLTSVILEGTADGSAWTITRTLTFDKLLVTPRWTLL